MSAPKGPRDERKDAAIVDNLLEDLFFSERGSKGKSGESRAIPKQPRPSGSVPKPTLPRRPSGSVPKPISPRRPSVSAVSVARPHRDARVGTWGRISVGVLIAIGMLQWPYDHACGFDLGFYLTAVAMVVVSAGWGSVFSWKNRMPMAHVVSQMLLLWGLVLGAGQVLPRVGYTKELATWRCVAAPAPAPAPAPGAPALGPTHFPESDPADEAATPAEETAPTVPDRSG